MNEILKTAMRLTLFYMAICLVVWAVAPGWRTIAAGLLLGSVASAFNALLLRRRIEALGQAAATGGSKRSMGLGLSSRIATVLIVAMIAYRYPDRFALPATLISCFSVQFAAFIAAVFHNNRQLRRKG